MLIDWFTVAAQVVNFLALVWLLKRFLYKPVLAAIDAREKKIAAELEDAEKKKAEASREQAEFQKKNEDFEKQRSTLLLEARNASNTEGKKLLEAVRGNAEELKLKLQKSIADERETLNRMVVTLVQCEVFSIARKALTDLAGASLEERMAYIFLHRLHELKRQQLEGFKASPKRALIRSAFELPLPEKKLIEEAVQALLGETKAIVFEVRSDLICGIEFMVDGQKMAWSVGDYLTSLTQKMDSLLKIGAPSLAATEEVSHAA